MGKGLDTGCPLPSTSLHLLGGRAAFSSQSHFPFAEPDHLSLAEVLTELAQKPSILFPSGP